MEKVDQEALQRLWRVDSSTALAAVKQLDLLDTPEEEPDCGKIPVHGAPEQPSALGFLSLSEGQAREI